MLSHRDQQVCGSRLAHHSNCMQQWPVLDHCLSVGGCGLSSLGIGWLTVLYIVSTNNDLWSCIMHRADDLLVRKKGIMPASAGCMLCKHVPYQHACAAFRARPDMCKPKPTYEEVQQQLLCCKLHVHTAHHVMACRDIAGCFHFAETLLIHMLLQIAPAHCFVAYRAFASCFHSVSHPSYFASSPASATL